LLRLFIPNAAQISRMFNDFNKNTETHRLDDWRSFERLRGVRWEKYNAAAKYKAQEEGSQAARQKHLGPHRECYRRKEGASTPTHA
jgi:hypothetical protein